MRLIVVLFSTVVMVLTAACDPKGPTAPYTPPVPQAPISVYPNPIPINMKVAVRT